jgi:membrane protease YdiL (CAAX protease family)
VSEVTDRQSEIDPGREDSPPGAPLRKPGGYPRSNPNTLYIVMLVLAMFGFIAMKTAQVILERHQPPGIHTPDTTGKLTEMLEQFPWLGWAALGLAGLGTVLLLVYAALRLGGIRPILRQKQNEVTWTLGAILKGFIITFFTFIALNFIVPVFLRSFSIVDMSMILGAAVEIFAVLWILLMLKMEYGARISDAGINFKAPFRDIAYGFLTYLAIFPLIHFVALAWKWLGESLGFEHQTHSAIVCLLETGSIQTVILVSASALIIAPLIEEFLFRGFIYPAARKRFGVTVAILSSSALFALVHQDFFSFLPIMILGVAMAFLYERRQSLVAPVALHFFHNLRAIGLILYLKYMST